MPTCRAILGTASRPIHVLYAQIEEKDLPGPMAVELPGSQRFVSRPWRVMWTPAFDPPRGTVSFRGWNLSPTHLRPIHG
jgi:hypothetical protein